MIGYKRPDQLHKDDPVFDVLNGILSSGRTGLLYKDLVRDKKLALMAASETYFPGSKYANVFVLFVLPSMGRSTEENEKACYDILEKLKKEKVDAETLGRVKTKIRASLLRSLDSNSGLAEQMTSYHVNYGDWRKMFTGLEEINKVTAEDVQRVVREYFTPASRTVAYSVSPKPEEGAGK
jgi:predicted Zn-dependent peptidase